MHPNTAARLYLEPVPIGWVFRAPGPLITFKVSYLRLFHKFMLSMNHRGIFMPIWGTTLSLIVLNFKFYAAAESSVFNSARFCAAIVASFHKL